MLSAPPPVVATREKDLRPPRRRPSRVVSLTLLAAAVVAAIGGGIAWTLANDTQFIPQPLPAYPPLAQLDSLSCSPTGHCVAVGDGTWDATNENVNDVLANDGPGGAWEVAPPIAGAGDSVIAATCLRTGCVAVTARGTLWAFEVRDSPGGGAYTPLDVALGAVNRRGDTSAGGLACDPSGSFCLLLAGYTSGFGVTSVPPVRVFATLNIARDGLETWVRTGTIRDRGTAATINGPPLRPSCGAPDVCMAIVTSRVHGTFSRGWVWRTTDAGRQWRLLRLPSGNPSSISCASASACAVGTVGGTVEFTNDGGRSWTMSAVPGWPAPACGANEFACQNEQPVTGISCWSAQGCAVSTSGEGSSTNGAPLPSGGVMETLDGGRTWSPVSVPAVLINGLSCAGPGGCWAYGWPNVVGDSGPIMIHWG